MLQKTSAQEKIAKLRKRIRIVRGGTSSSKTFSIIPMLITYAVQNPKCEISVVSETIPHLRRGAIRDFLKIMDMVGMYDANKLNKSSLTYTFSNESYIEFFSADQPQKLRGARRDVLFVNEANEIDLEKWRQLLFRTTGKVIIDYNPSMFESWIYDHVLTRDDCALLITTYKDNPHLSPDIIREIEALASVDPEYWKIFGLGERGQLKDIVFSEWQQVPQIPTDAKLIGHGLDFGFTNDPTTLVSVYQQDGELWVDERLYRTNMTNNDIGNYLKSINFNRNDAIVADSAEPKSIRELQLQGFNVQPASKGPDSIVASIDILKRYKIVS